MGLDSTLTHDHSGRVDFVSQQLRQRSATTPVSILKGTVSHQVPKRADSKYSDDKIDIGSLSNILEINETDRTCTAEPGVTFVDLVRETLKHGLAPIVVPELKTITLGGAVSGCSLESMSFRYGGFHDTCLEYDVIAAGGEVLHCTPDNENKLVFQMMHGSFGTLGILARLKFKLVPARPFVHVVYERYETLTEFKAAIDRNRAREDVDFLDGIIHSPNLFALNVGRFVDQAPYTHRYDWTRIYYQSTAKRAEDYLATADYFFRYDQGVTSVFPKSFAGRLLFGKLFSSANLLRLGEKFHAFLPERGHRVIVDLFIPFSRVDDFLEWYGRTIGYFPLWCVPYRRVHDYEWLSPDFYKPLKDDLFLDLAIYGLKQPPGRNVYKEIEAELPLVNGTKTLISYNYYDEETFWRYFNHPNYEAVKKITDPQNIFRDLYAKTCRAARGLDA